MAAFSLWSYKRSEYGLYLQRKLWNPLQGAVGAFHALPLVAGIILFLLLATAGQLREVYIGYLEDAGTDSGWVIKIIVALAVVALISAVLCETHYALSRVRRTVTDPNLSNFEALVHLRLLQRTVGAFLAFLPWLGLTVGLFGARNFVVQQYCQLLNVAHIAPAELQTMQYLSSPGRALIFGGLNFLGVALALSFGVGEQNAIQRLVAGLFPSLLIALLFLLFTDGIDISQFRPGTAVGLGMAAVVGALIYWQIYEWLYRRRSTYLFARVHYGTGFGLRRRRRLLLAIWLYLPWLVLAFYLAGLSHPTALPPASWLECPLPTSTTLTLGRWIVFPTAMCFTIAIGLVLSRTLGLFPTTNLVRWTKYAVAFPAVVVLALSFSNNANYVVVAYRFVGPLATVSLQLLFLISLLAVLAVLSRRSGFPALAIIILAVVISTMFPEYEIWIMIFLAIVCIVFTIMAWLSRRFETAAILLIIPALVLINWYELWSETIVAQNTTDNTTVTSSVKDLYSCWLQHRGVSVSTKAASQQPSDCAASSSAQSMTFNQSTAGRFPVFIIAAEGGGIYAASAAMTFLARVEESTPGFAEHVFAISGVSGGSIGAAIFQAFDQSNYPNLSATELSSAVKNPRCAQYLAPGSHPDALSLSEKTAHVAQDDHFSPVVGSIFPELFGARLTRPDALAGSFEYSASAEDRVAGQILCAPFAQHWSTAASSAPALVLNSTWVETGFRVAFAPFHLHELDESLYSFSDANMPTVDCDRLAVGSSCASLMSAAVVSARFPLILPPYSPAMANKRWNFVDGAYSDNSGASTALDLFKSLRSFAPSVDLYLILITSSNPQPNLVGNDINGTAFRDTMAPLDAIMKVRSDLGDAAVARACTTIYPDESANQPAVNSASISSAHTLATEANETCIDHAGSRDGKLQIVEIQDQTYRLALGWKISKTSFAVVSWMLGTVNQCREGGTQGQTTLGADPPGSIENNQAHDVQLTDVILNRNSCVQKLIHDLVPKHS